MEKQRQIKILSIVALVLAISAMTLGFAAFSTTLSISSSATVTPSSEAFKVVFSAVSNDIINSNTIGNCVGVPTTGTSGGSSISSSGCIGETEFKKAVAEFSAPGQEVGFIFYVHNVGKYDAYLKNVTFSLLDNGANKKCYATTSDSTKAADSLVDAACDGISFSVGGYSETAVNISESVIPQGTVKEIVVNIKYEEGAERADGPFKVEFGDVVFEYSTVDNSANLISFTIDGTTYQAEEGMTWGEWVDSQYSNGLFNIYNGTYVKSNSGYYISNSNGNVRVVQGNLITDSGIYNYTSGGVTVH